MHIRWMIRRDMTEVLGIENKSSEFPWTEQDFIRCLRQRNCIGMVGEATAIRGGVMEDRVVTFMVYELHKEQLHLLNLAVHPRARNRGFGRTMVGKLQSKLSVQRRNKILLEIRETNLRAQLFFKSLGFRATSVLRDFYDEEDAYVMRFGVNRAVSMSA